jgi:O-methyltransferase involved in polyketide biosynthesis
MAQNADNSKNNNISPTAHYTGYVWVANDLSHPSFATLKGQALYAALRGPHWLSERLNGVTMDAILLARHTLIDLQLERAIASGAITQVIEIASGLSPRGWRFAERHGDAIEYIEADLPAMAQRKRELLFSAGLDSPNHRVVDIDAFSDEGALSLDALMSTLDRRKGTAIITEGLLNYFDTDSVIGLWGRIADALGRMQRGLYLADIHLGHLGEDLASKAFLKMLSAFVRGQVHLHFDSDVSAEQALELCGFGSAHLLRPRDFAERLPHCRAPGVNRVRVIAARTGRWD